MRLLHVSRPLYAEAATRAAVAAPARAFTRVMTLLRPTRSFTVGRHETEPLAVMRAPSRGATRAGRRQRARALAIPHSRGVRQALRQRQEATAAAFATETLTTTTTETTLPAATLATLESAVAAPARTRQARTGSLGVRSAEQGSERELRNRVWGLALPAIGEQLLALGVGLSDTFLSGHLSTAAIAHLGYGRAIAVDAVGVASTAAWVVLTAFFAVNIGVTALVARATGAKDGRLAVRAAGQGIVMGFIAGALMLGLSVPLASVLTSVLGVSGQVATLAAAFIRIYSLGLPATGIASACTAAMRGAGDARRPLAVMLVVNGMNIVSSWALMNGVPGLGVAPIGVLGSATGAAAGWTLGAVIALALLWRRHPRAPKLEWAAFRFDRGLCARILHVGLPSAAELTVFQIGIVSFLRFVVVLGPAAYAANTAINTVESMGTLPGFGFAVATTSLVGQALGANNPEQATRIVWIALKRCVAVMGAIALLALLAPHALLGLFVADSAVLSAGDIAMRLSIFTLPASAAAFVFIGALRGAGDTKFPVVARAIGTWGVRVPLALLLIPHLALPGARIAMATDFWVQAAITFWRFRSGRWRRAKV